MNVSNLAKKTNINFKHIIVTLCILLMTTLNACSQTKEEEKSKTDTHLEQDSENNTDIEKKPNLYIMCSYNNVQKIAIYFNNESIYEYGFDVPFTAGILQELIPLHLIKKKNLLKVVVNDGKHGESKMADVEVSVERVLTPSVEFHSAQGTNVEGDLSPDDNYSFPTNSEKLGTIKWTRNAKKASLNSMTFEKKIKLSNTDIALANTILEEEKRKEENQVFGKTYMFHGNLNISDVDCEIFINDMPVCRGTGGSISASYHECLKTGTNTISVLLRPHPTSDTDIPTNITTIRPSIYYTYGKLKPGEFAGQGIELASIDWKANGGEQYPIVLKNTFELSEKDFPVSFPWHKAEVITKEDIKKAEELTIAIHKHLKSGTLEELSSIFKPSFIKAIAYPGADDFYKNEEAEFYELVKKLANNYTQLPVDKKNMDFKVLNDLFIQAINKDGTPTISASNTKNSETFWDISLLFIKLNGELFVGRHKFKAR